MKNNINKGRFVFVFSGHDSKFILDDISAVELPSVDMSATEIPLEQGFVAKRTSGAPLNFSDLTLEFFVDENLDNYFYFYDWMIAQNNPSTGIADNILRQGVLIINNEEKTILREIEFVNLQPISLPTIRFESTNEDVGFEMANVSFSLDFMRSKK
jgi:hypothetical protein